MVFEEQLIPLKSQLHHCVGDMLAIATFHDFLKELLVRRGHKSSWVVLRA